MSDIGIEGRSVERAEVTVTVEPKGVTFALAPDQTIFAAADASGVRWPTICGGTGSCGVCIMTVLSGAEDLNEISPWEREILEKSTTNASVQGQLRLACQTRSSRDVRVFKRGVRRVP